MLKTYTIRKFDGASYGEAQILGKGDGSMSDIRRVARREFTFQVTVSRQDEVITILVPSQGEEYRVFVEPQTHPDN